MSDPNAAPVGSAVPSYLASLVRTGLAFGAGWLVSKGYITAEQSAELIGAGLVAATALWSLIQKHNAHKALAGNG